MGAAEGEDADDWFGVELAGLSGEIGKVEKVQKFYC